MTHPLALDASYDSIDAGIQALGSLEQAFRKQHDRRAIFVTAYLSITRAIGQNIAAGAFLDNAWVTRYALCFANLYRKALLAYETGDTLATPKAWQIAFDTAKRGEALAIQDLVLGINAHINHDLALALNEVSIDPDRATRYADHTKVNDVLKAATDPLQDRIGQVYAPILNLLDNACDRIDEDIACFSVEKAREDAWGAALALANARSELERAAVRAGLNTRSAVLARLVLAPTFEHPWVVAALHHLETITPWTRFVLLSGPEWRGQWDFTPAGDATRLQFQGRLAFTGRMRLFERLIARGFKRQLDANFARLKRVLEDEKA